MPKLDREEIERIIEEILRSKGYLLTMEKLATKEDLKFMMDFMGKRFEAMDKRFEDLLRYIDKRFEAVDKRFEAVDKRFEAVDKRFEELDKRFRIFTSVFFAFNIPLLLGILAILIKMVF